MGMENPLGMRIASKRNPLGIEVVLRAVQKVVALNPGTGTPLRPHPETGYTDRGNTGCEIEISKILDTEKRLFSLFGHDLKDM
jgi:hypothetical protein